MVKSVNEEGAETAYAYDADGRLISMTDALGNVTGFEYDSRDRVIKVTDAKGNATTFTYIWQAMSRARPMPRAL
mgnify:CR=1 FL=1